MPYNTRSHAREASHQNSTGTTLGSVATQTNTSSSNAGFEGTTSRNAMSLQIQQLKSEVEKLQVELSVSKSENDNWSDQSQNWEKTKQFLQKEWEDSAKEAWRMKDLLRVSEEKVNRLETELASRSHKTK
nr:uncharacterized protein CI109_007348 [Kwoniella shandongensis]KAA5524335.1 hypothetical protein CI109_007348 [Kwoniella shandongensis]